MFAARVAGLKAWGFPGSIANIKDIEAYTRQVEQGKSMGFDGVMCIHPNQVELVNRIYAGKEPELAAARKIVEAFADAERQGNGAIEVEGRMVDSPVVERAKALLKKEASKVESD